MKKSAYSLVLSDDVIREIDKLAYSMNTSRSNLVNQILAEYASFVTPEKRISHILGEIRERFSASEAFQIPPSSSASMMLLRSALDYKYNPTVRYSIELTPDALPQVGTLRVSLRTQNSTLIVEMIRFYRLWCELEQDAIGRQKVCIEQEKFSRSLTLQSPGGQNEIAVGSEELSEMITDYIRAFDSALKCYFTRLGSPVTALTEISRLYADYRSRQRIMI